MAKGGFPRGAMGMGGMGNMQQMMQKAQRMQEEMARTQAALEEREVSASAGGGMVSVTVLAGSKEIKSLEIKPEAVDPDDVEMLQDMVMAAVNEAIRQADELVKREMSKVTGGLNLGGLY